MEFDYSKLRGRIREVFGTEAAFAKAIEMGRVSLSHRLNNLQEFTSPEICKSCEALQIPHEQIPEYFFCRKVQKLEQVAKA